MNIFNKFFLYLVLLPSGFYRKMGVHIPHLKAILNTKLKMDDRRAPAIQQVNRKQKDKPANLATIGSMFMAAVMGCLFLFAFAVGNNMVTHLTIYFFMYIFVLASMLIADFTTVLIDVRDNFIILPKPVNDETFLLSRLLHIVIHICKLVVPMSLPCILLVGFKEGLGGWLGLLPLLVSTTLLTVFLVNAVYVIILKITTPEKFKSIISYFQIFFAIFMYAGYQIIPRLIPGEVINSFDIESVSLKWLFPNYWLAAGWQYITGGNWGSVNAVYFVLCVLAPVICIWAVIRFFGPSFNQKLSMISGSEGGPVKQKAIAQQKKKGFLSRYVHLMAVLLTKQGSERMSFLQTWKITSRSRYFKMKVYPSIGYVLVYFTFMIFSKRGITFNNLGEHPELFLVMLYFSGYTLLLAIYQLIYSDKFKAAWIYYITPIDVPGKLLSGGVKSLFAKFFVPFAGIIVIFCLVCMGPGIIPNLILGIANQVLTTSFIAYLVLGQLPFSVSESTPLKGGNFLAGLFSLLIPGALGVAHFFLYKYNIAIIIVAALSCAAAWMMMNAIHDKSWAKIKLKEYAG